MVMKLLMKLNSPILFQSAINSSISNNQSGNAAGCFGARKAAWIDWIDEWLIDWRIASLGLLIVLLV